MTVVGSYPVIARRTLSTLFDPLSHAVRVAVDDQVRAGITLISDGQVRGEMIRAFVSVLPGVHGQEVTGPVQPPDKPVTLADTRYALSRHKYVKGILTGPTTLAHGLRIATPVYRDRGDLALDLARALGGEARALAREGITMLQVDEPIFSTGAADLDAARGALESITDGLEVPVSLHVCGHIGGVIDDLLKMPVDMLDLEFAHSPENLDVLSGRELHGRMIGFGCVDTIDPLVETPDVVMARIRRGIDLFGAENIMVDPDCGLRMHSRETAFAKLSRLAGAAESVRSDL